MVGAGPTITIPDLDIIGIALIITALGVIFALLKRGNRFFKKANQVMDDWNGIEPENGHDGSPGVMQRFRIIDDTLADHKETQQRIEKKVDDAIHELTPNKGGSIKDSVTRIEIQQQEEILERKVRQAEYDADKKKNRLEWVKVFEVVRKMITMEDADQIKIWDELTHKYITDTLVDPEDQQL